MIVTQHGKKPVDIIDESHFIETWRPIDGWLVQERAGKFVLPTHHSTFGAQFYFSYTKTVKRNLIYLFAIVATIIFIIYSFIPTALNQIPILGVLVTVATVDMLLSIRNLDNCRQKVLFLYKTQRSIKSKLIMYGIFFCLIFLGQIYASHHMGGLENLVVSYGNYYPKIGVDSLWRFIVGPLIHGNMNHWLINAILTIIYSSMLPIKKNFPNFVLFFIAAIVSHITTFLVNVYFSTPFDSLIGASGGTYGLLAFAICDYYKKQQLSIACSLLGLIVFSELSISLSGYNGSHTAHLSGFFTGVIAYYFYKKTNK